MTIQDLVKKLRVLVAKRGDKRVHAQAMTLPNLRAILRWSYRECPDSLLEGPIDSKIRQHVTHHLYFRALVILGFVLWTR